MHTDLSFQYRKDLNLTDPSNTWCLGKPEVSSLLEVALVVSKV